MSVESAADRAALFDTDEWAVAGTYTPAGGDPVAVDVILDEPHTEADLRMLDVVDRGYVAHIRKDQLAAAARDDALVVGAQTFRVSDARLELSGQIWRLRLEVAS